MAKFRLSAGGVKFWRFRVVDYTGNKIVTILVSKKKVRDKTRRVNTFVSIDSPWVMNNRPTISNGNYRENDTTITPKMGINTAEAPKDLIIMNVCKLKDIPI